jgi:hypothetical protein
VSAAPSGTNAGPQGARLERARAALAGEGRAAARRDHLVGQVRLDGARARDHRERDLDPAHDGAAGFVARRHAVPDVVREELHARLRLDRADRAPDHAVGARLLADPDRVGAAGAAEVAQAQLALDVLRRHDVREGLAARELLDQRAAPGGGDVAAHLAVARARAQRHDRDLRLCLLERRFRARGDVAIVRRKAHRIGVAAVRLLRPAGLHRGHAVGDSTRPRPTA